MKGALSDRFLLALLSILLLAVLVFEYFLLEDRGTDFALGQALTEQQKTEAISIAMIDSFVNNELKNAASVLDSTYHFKDVVGPAQFYETGPGINRSRILPAVEMVIGYEGAKGTNILAFVDLSQVKGRDTRINYETKNACPVMANELLKDAFSHIIMNSIKHSSGSLTINVNLREVHENGKGYCRVEFEDNGPGIPDEVKKKLLTNIQETEDKKSRIGLGLRFVKTLVDAYRGKVWMEDRVAGDYSKGVRLIVMLPAAE